jgi:hypothetical protein
MNEAMANNSLSHEIEEWRRQGSKLRARLTDERTELLARLKEIERQLSSIPAIGEPDGRTTARKGEASSKPSAALIETAKLVNKAGAPVDRAWLAKQLGTNNEAAGTRLSRAVAAGLIQKGSRKGTFEKIQGAEAP